LRAPAIPVARARTQIPRFARDDRAVSGMARAVFIIRLYRSSLSFVFIVRLYPSSLSFVFIVRLYRSSLSFVFILRRNLCIVLAHRVP
jgi:hypothetical protein